MRPRALPPLTLLSQRKPPSSCQFSITPHKSPTPSSTPSPPPAPNPRWLSTTKSRLGHCISFGLSRPQTRAAGLVLETLGTSWRDLVAGSEGFLVDRKYAGLLRHRVVWGEMDCMGHVNNVTYTRYAESARINWAGNYALYHDRENGEAWRELWTPRGDGLILRSIRTDYKFPMTYPDHISVFHKLSSLPSSDSDSFTLDVLILSELEQRIAARCVEDVVVYDYRAKQKVQIRKWMRDAFERTWVEQERARERNRKRREWVDELVRGVERESWDREGAREDMGSAGG